LGLEPRSQPANPRSSMGHLLLYLPPPLRNGGGGQTGDGQGGAGSPTAGGTPAAPLTITVNGQTTTIAPTVVAGSAGGSSVTAFIVGPGTTLTAGESTVINGTPVIVPAAASTSLTPLIVTISGSAVTISPTVVANPTGTGSITGFVIGPGTTLTPGEVTTIDGSRISVPVVATGNGGIGGAIASGLGYTGPLSTGMGSVVGPNLPLGVLAFFAGMVGTAAVVL
jgi:hypothetical protein